MFKLFIIASCLVLVSCASTSNSIQNNSTRVIGKGNTFEEAKQNAFKEAIEFKVGSLVLSERETLNMQLVKDDILVYSAGYIDDYSIINQSTQNNYVYVTMDVLVAESKLNHRLLSSGLKIKEINGEKIHTQYNSLLAERKSGDAILATVLNDYPKRAFNITQGVHYFKIDSNRNGLLIIPYDMGWNYNYIVSLNEALSLLSTENRTSVTGKVTIMAKDPKDFIIGKRSIYKFDELHRLDQLNQAMTWENTAHIQVTIQDRNLYPIYQSCYESQSINGMKPSFYYSGNDFVIKGNERDQDNIIIPIELNSNLNTILKDSYRIELSLVTYNNCIGGIKKR